MTITLNVTERDATKSAKSLRANGEVPAVIYGSSQAAISVTVNGKEFEKVLKEAGESTILELTGLDKKTEVLLKEVDFNPVKQEVIHADFY
ncbi:50S ribosomal protein L25, partial [Candidatus Kaiserbacteria bacterium]|nr:50S ribosomal protein L25 [Candidatus Kaiserbacteria bacterium]